MKLLVVLCLALVVATSCRNKTKNVSGDTTYVPEKNTPNTDSLRPKLFLKLPDSCNTPDGLALDSSGDIYLSMPNFNDPTATARIYKITQADTMLHPFVDLPVRPDTKHAGPMDLAFSPDSNLYINDNQYELYDKNYKSRVLKVTIQHGKPVKVETVVDGLRLANGMVWVDKDLYVTDSQWDTPQDTTKSAIFHFTLAELNSGKPVRLQPGYADNHILDTFTTHVGPDKIDNGVDGIDYDSRGNLITGIFGDGTVYKLILNPPGKLAKREVFVPQGLIPCVDGLVIDRMNDNIYIADAKSNAIRKVSSDGLVSTVWKNPDTDGKSGLLDQPAEVLLRAENLIVANFDKPMKGFVNKKFDKLHTLSVIDLSKKK